MTKTVSSPIVNFLKEQQFSSLAIIRLVGYGLLAMALIDFVTLLIPPQFMNPVWEFQTLGLIVERMPIVLLGFVFIFYGEREERTLIEHKLLKWISWFSLVFAIFLFLSFPLSIINSFRLYYGHNAQINSQIGNRIEVLDKFNSELRSAESLEEIGSVLQQQSKNKIDIPASVDKNKLKKDILQNLKQNKEHLTLEASMTKKSQKNFLLKNAFKWNLGSLISGFILIFVWRQTYWTRLMYEPETE